MADNMMVLLQLMRAAATEAGVAIIVSPEAHVAYNGDDSMKCSGYFVDVPTPTLAVALRAPNWELILLHEFCHMEQWSSKSYVWEAQAIVPGTTLAATDLIDAWIAGQKFTPMQLDEAFKRATNVEVDCERRVVNKIKKYNLPYDIEDYAQKANAYVRFYSFIRKYRKWYAPGREPYNIPEVWQGMPKSLDYDPEFPYDSLHPAHEALFKQCIA